MQLSTSLSSDQRLLFFGLTLLRFNWHRSTKNGFISGPVCFINQLLVDRNTERIFIFVELSGLKYTFVREFTAGASCWSWFHLWKLLLKDDDRTSTSSESKVFILFPTVTITCDKKRYYKLFRFKVYFRHKQNLAGSGCLIMSYHDVQTWRPNMTSIHDVHTWRP